MPSRRRRFSSSQGDGAGRSAQRGTSGAATGPGGRSPLTRMSYLTETSAPLTRLSYLTETSAPLTRLSYLTETSAPLTRMSYLTETSAPLTRLM
jgi:hypothetical protein